jgi:hypothetical protein
LEKTKKGAENSGDDYEYERHVLLENNVCVAKLLRMQGKVISITYNYIGKEMELFIENRQIQTQLQLNCTAYQTSYSCVGLNNRETFNTSQNRETMNAFVRFLTECIDKINNHNNPPPSNTEIVNILRQINKIFPGLLDDDYINKEHISPRA